MPTDEYIGKVVDLADATLDAYRPERLLYQALQPLDDEDPPEDGTFYAFVAGESNDLRGVTATFDAIRLAFDAAVVVVSYAETQPGSDDGEMRRDFLRRLAAEPTWTLEIESLSAGSFKGVFKAVFVKKRGRSSLIAIAGIAGAILTAVVPPVGVVTLVVVTGVECANLLVDNVLEARLEKRIKSAELAEDRNVEAELGRLKEENADLHNKLAGLSERLADVEAIADAKVTDVRVGVVPDPGSGPA